MGDSKLIIKQINVVYMTRDPRLIFYRGRVLEILNTFLETKLAVIPRKHNMQAHSLAMFSSTCKLPFQPNHQYTADVRNRPAILDNLKNWKVFTNDQQINNFLTLEEEFVNSNIDTDITCETDFKNEIEINEIEDEEIDRFHPTKFTKLDVENLKQVEIDEIIDEDSKIINLKDNFFPKGLTPLEDLFDSNDVPRKQKMEPLKSDIQECNIGTKENKKLIKLSKSLPPAEKVKYLELLKEFQDVFAWSYEYLKSYATNIIQHTIPIKENQKPFRQKLRRINPILLPSIEKEIRRMYEAKIITPLRFSGWVSNLVPTRKKTDKIRLCVDLRNLNKVSLKDNHPLPEMDHTLQRVLWSTRISLLDGFSGYNHILVHPDDQAKTAFATPSGTFIHVKMPFGLKNAEATFQIAMDIAFAKEIHDFLVIYLDDIIVLSKFDKQHLDHLRQVFIKCKKYEISLNLKKSLFGLKEGKLLGHIISKDSIRIDPARIEAILQIQHPRSIREL